MARPRFSPFHRLFSFPFSHFESNFRRFSMAHHSFQPQTSIFPCSVLYFPTLRALLREISPFIFPTLPFVHSVKTFSFRASLILHALLHLHIPIAFLSALHSPHPLHSSPTFFLFPPHFSIPLPNKRTNARTLAQYARTRMPAHPRTSGGFHLLPSPLHPPFAIRCTSTH